MTEIKKRRLIVGADWATAGLIAFGMPVSFAILLGLSDVIGALLGILCGQCAAIYLLLRGRLF